MDILRIFKMQEPVSKELLSRKNDIGKYKECVLEKEVILKNQKEKIKDLELYITDLKGKNLELESVIKMNGISIKHNLNGDTIGNEFQKTMQAYEDFISDIIREKEQLETENESLINHIQKLDEAFNKLLQKYDKAKDIIQGLKSNEDILQKTIIEHEDLIDILNKKQDLIKIHNSNHSHTPKASSYSRYSKSSNGHTRYVSPKSIVQ